MAEGLCDALVSIEKLAIDEWPWHTPKVITVATIKWPYGISLLVCGLLFQHLYLGPCSRHYHFWSERDCLWPWELLHFWQWSLSHKPGALCNLCVNIRSRITLYLWVISITKVSNSKSDLQTHSRTLAVMPFDRPCMISYLSFIVTMYLSCTVSKILSVISQNLITSRDSENLKSLPLPTTKIWKTTNNAEIGVVWWFGVTQGHRQHSNWIQHIWLPNWL